MKPQRSTQRVHPIGELRDQHPFVSANQCSECFHRCHLLHGQTSVLIHQGNRRESLHALCLNPIQEQNRSSLYGTQEATSKDAHSVPRLEGQIQQESERTDA